MKKSILKLLGIILIVLVIGCDNNVDAKNTSQYKYTQNTFIDTTTGLEWQDNKIVKVNLFNWEEANNYCHKLVLNNKKNWRLPTFDELKDLYIKKSKLKSFQRDSFWSSTIDNNDNNRIWAVYFKEDPDTWNHEKNMLYMFVALMENL